jgi:hypothetical protein
MGLKKDKFTTRINNFFVFNWWLVGIASIVMVVLMIQLIMKQSAMEEHFRAELDRTMSNIVVATPDGRIALVDKSFVNTDTDVFKNHIALIIKQNMIGSEGLFTHGFDPNVASKLKSPQNLLELTDNFKLLANEYFSNNEVTNNFVRTYFTLLRKGELPKKATVMSSSYRYEPLEGGGFTITIDMKVAKDFINKVTNKYVELVVTDTITVYGFIQPTAYSSPLNPLGVRFTGVKMSLYLYSNYDGAKGR